MDSEQKFIKGFNAGYLLAKHNRKLSQTLKRGVQQNDNPYTEGFFKGTLEYDREQLRERAKSQSKEKGHDRSK